MQDIQEAEEFYEEYLEVAPNDNTRYILKYKISKSKTGIAGRTDPYSGRI